MTTQIFDISPDIENFKNAEALRATIIEALSEVGLSITLENNFENWVELQGKLDSTSSPSAAFDPHLHSNMEGFWIKVEDEESGKIVGWHVARIVENCRDFIREWIITNRFFDGSPSLNSPVVELLPEMPMMRGTVCVTGALRVFPEWRGKSLSTGTSIASGISLITRMTAILAYNIDFGAGFIEAKKGNFRDQMIPARGWANVVPFVRGYYRGRAHSMAVDLHWSSSDEIFDHAANGLQEELRRMAV